MRNETKTAKTGKGGTMDELANCTADKMRTQLAGMVISKVREIAETGYDWSDTGNQEAWHRDDISPTVDGVLADLVAHGLPEDYEYDGTFDCAVCAYRRTAQRQVEQTTVPGASE